MRDISITLEQINKSNISTRSTIKVKDHITKKFYDALGITEENVERLSKERLGKYAAGFFLASWNSTFNTFQDVTTNFRIPDLYHVSEIHDDYIKIIRYPGMKEGYKELSSADIEKYEKLVKGIKLSYNDFYLMGNSH